MLAYVDSCNGCLACYRFPGILTLIYCNTLCQQPTLVSSPPPTHPYLQGLLSPYKLPRLIAATWPLGSPLPCNSSGKVLKVQVRETMLAILGAEAQHERKGRLSVRKDGRLSRLQEVLDALAKFVAATCRNWHSCAIHLLACQTRQFKEMKAAHFRLLSSPRSDQARATASDPPDHH
eukprot:1160229-Pelagomonas_calceolata.AAC.1